jgi:pectinesterase
MTPTVEFLKIVLSVLCLLPTFVCSQTKETLAIPRDTSFTVYGSFKKERGKYPFISIVRPQLPDGVATDENVVYVEHGNRQLHLDIFYPANKVAGPYPGVILIHGGGWRSGDRSHQVPMAQQLAARGYVAAAVEYRLSPEAGYPAAIHDIKAAIRWLRENADKYHIDSGKIAVSGCSAGGQIASLIGVTNGLVKFEGLEAPDFSSDVQAIVNIDGLLDFTSVEARSFEDVPDKPSSAGNWFGGRYREKPDLWKEASPIYYASEKTPPIIFINSSIPRFHVGRDEMIEKLEKIGVYYEVHTLPDTPHPFWLFHPWFETTVELVDNFLKQVFKKQN